MKLGRYDHNLFLIKKYNSVKESEPFIYLMAKVASIYFTLPSLMKNLRNIGLISI